jgi:hypothetical protein
MPSGALIPFAHSVARHCRRSDFTFGPDGEPDGLNETAFRPRPDDDTGLSVIWVDYFTGTPDHKLNCVRSVVNLAVRASQRLAIVRIMVINAAFRSGGKTAEVKEDPCDDLPPEANAAHALVAPATDLQDVTIRTAIASSVRSSDLVPYKLTP